MKTNQMQKLFLFFMLSVACFSSRAQLQKDFFMFEKENKYMLSLVPLPLIVHAFEVDFDVKLKEQLWLSIAPQYNNDKKELNGFGLSVNLRYYDAKYKHLYYSIGGFFDANHVRGTTNSDKQNPSHPVDYDVNSARIGGQIQIGGIFQIFPRTTLDVFGGFGFRHGIMYKFSENSSIIEMRNLNINSYLKGGAVIQLGVRIGVLL